MNTFTASYGDASASIKQVEKKVKALGSTNQPAAKAAAKPAAPPAAKPAVKPTATSTSEPEKPKFYVKKLGALFTFQ